MQIVFPKSSLIYSNPELLLCFRFVEFTAEVTVQCLYICPEAQNFISGHTESYFRLTCDEQISTGISYPILIHTPKLILTE